jgi:tRNA threonylcarbamoyladenosine biosynthesis protein TsaB
VKCPEKLLLGEILNLTLAINTAGKVASVAISDGLNIISQISYNSGKFHSQIVIPLCTDLLKHTELSIDDIDVFAVANGPGSYTGIRIGIAAIKGMAYAKNKPCCGVSSLEALAYNLYGLSNSKITLVCSVMPARQELVYNSVFRLSENKITRLTPDEILPSSVLQEKLLAYDEPILFTGDGIEEFTAEFADFFREIHSFDGVALAPLQLRLQNAASVCIAAEYAEKTTAYALQAVYLEPTKAEKELVST